MFCHKQGKGSFLCTTKKILHVEWPAVLKAMKNFKMTQGVVTIPVKSEAEDNAV